MKREKNNMYYAKKGYLIVEKSTGEIMGDTISLGTEDSIDNYEEKVVTEEERKAFFESIGQPIKESENEPSEKERKGRKMQ